MPKSHVLFVDDEPLPSQTYRDGLEESGFTIEYRSCADTGLEYLRDRYAEIDVVVLDMMMPTPKGVSTAATSDGQTTGIWFLLQCREIIETNVLPIYVLTNRGKKTLAGLIADQVLPINWVLEIGTKYADVTPQTLPGELQKLLAPKARRPH